MRQPLISRLTTFAAAPCARTTLRSQLAVYIAPQGPSPPRRKNELRSDGHSRSERLSCHGPLERLGECAVEVGDEGLDAGLQVLLGGEAGAAQQLAHEDGEPDLDLVQP